MYNIIINLYKTTYSICNLLRPFNVQKLVYSFSRRACTKLASTEKLEDHMIHTENKFLGLLHFQRNE